MADQPVSNAISAGNSDRSLTEPIYGRRNSCASDPVLNLVIELAGLHKTYLRRVSLRHASCVANRLVTGM
jgi:hypothetical protein